MRSQATRKAASIVRTKFIRSCLHAYTEFSEKAADSEPTLVEETKEASSFGSFSASNRHLGLNCFAKEFEPGS